MALLTAAEVSWSRERKGLFATSWSVEHDEQGSILYIALISYQYLQLFCRKQLGN